MTLFSVFNNFNTGIFYIVIPKIWNLIIESLRLLPNTSTYIVSDGSRNQHSNWTYKINVKMFFKINLFKTYYFGFKLYLHVGRDGPTLILEKVYSLKKKMGAKKRRLMKKKWRLTLKKLRLTR